MKKIIIVLLICLLLVGCGNKENSNIKVNIDDNVKDVNDNFNVNDDNSLISENSEMNNNNNSNGSNSSSNNNNSNNISKNTNNNDNNGKNNNKENNNGVINEQNNKNTSSNSSVDNSTNSNENNTNNDSNSIVYSANDNKVISTIENIDADVDNLLNSGNSEDIKSKAKGVFITLVDFVFYDGEINGITFNELTESGKAKVLQLIHTIDEKIENHFPGYKETISVKTSSAFKKASEVIKNGANNIKDFAREKLGDKYYQEIIDDKDEFVYYTKNALSIVGEVSSSLLNSAKEKLNSWYQNFKNSN